MSKGRGAGAQPTVLDLEVLMQLSTCRMGGAHVVESTKNPERFTRPGARMALHPGCNPGALIGPHLGHRMTGITVANRPMR